MIVALVEILEHRIGQVGDVGRVAAAVNAVDRIGQQGVLHGLVQNPVRRGVRAFHFIEHHALIGQLAVQAVQLVMPALLLEGVRPDQRVKRRVQVHIDQVVEILGVLAGHRVAGLVRDR